MAASFGDYLTNSIANGFVPPTTSRHAHRLARLAGPESDVDRLGVYAAPTVLFHGLHPPAGKAASVVRTNPDISLHEAGKLALLCLGGNPTVMELLWLSDYETSTPLGLELVRIRDAFLSARKVRDAYLGYATAQFKRLTDRGDGSFSADTRKRTAKHARHLMRLCHQGFTLYSTGQLVVELDNPQAIHDFGERVAAGDHQAATAMIASYERSFDHATTVVPDRPDEATVEAWLRRVRSHFYQPADSAEQSDPLNLSEGWSVDSDRVRRYVTNDCADDRASGE